MSSANLGYTAYQARTEWYMNHWGLPASIRESIMEDGRTKLGVMAFPPSTWQGQARSWWTYATNGMSQRRMPCEEQPHGDPAHRLELLAYATAAADWVSDLLIEMARYPFVHRSGLAVGHTLPVTPQPGNLWSGFLLLHPRLEPDAFNPLGLDVGIGSDSIIFAQVMGLKADELQLAIEIGGPEFERTVVAQHPGTHAIDVDRTSFLSPDQRGD